MKVVHNIALLIVAGVAISAVVSAQTEETQFHGSAKGAWSGTHGVCNVCHEPYQAHYATKQQAPYQNHQVTSATFTGNKLDGAPVLIRAEKGPDKCQSCHAQRSGIQPAKTKTGDSCRR